jgi:hypothetical protein
VLPSMSGDEVVLGTLAQKNQTAQIKISFGHWHLGTESIYLYKHSLGHYYAKNEYLV